MPEEIKTKSGINKLNQDELQILSKWINLQKDKQTTHATPKKHDQKTKEKQQDKIVQAKNDNIGFAVKQVTGTITSKIIGMKVSNDKKIIFELENGQQWQQTSLERFPFNIKNKPSITIKPKSFGSWGMYVNNNNRGFKVKRIK